MLSTTVSDKPSASNQNGGTFDDEIIERLVVCVREQNVVANGGGQNPTTHP